MGLFFIRRPVFAWVLALMTMLAGAWSFVSLPVAQYPDIAPTAVRVGASRGRCNRLWWASSPENFFSRNG